MQRIDAEPRRRVPHSASLTEGVDKMTALWCGLDDMAVSDRSLIWNSDLVEALELDNLMGNAMTTMVAPRPARRAAARRRTTISRTATMRTG